MRTGRPFVCDLCGGQFLSSWSQADAEQEFQERFPEKSTEPVEQRAVLCDDCYARFMEWLKANPQVREGR